MSAEKGALKECRTAGLWLQYMDMVDLLRNFIKSERTGDWNLNLQVLYDMLPYMAASGHHHYTKSIYLYLQKLSKLSDEHPEIQQHFESGLHVVRRSDRFWAGLSTDLVIEQSLMRSLKTTGGLTRGRGMGEVQRLIWLLSSPICAEINNSMQHLTSVNIEMDEMHKELRPARQERDTSDTHKIIQCLASKNPFDTQDHSLHAIDTGITASDNVNVDNALQIGNKIIYNMVGKKVTEHSFKRKDQVITLESKSSVNTGSDEVSVDPLLLFQRLVTAGTNSGELSEVLAYELCSYAPSLFEGNGVLLSSNKASLADALWNMTSCEVAHLPEDVQYVLDGGALLHRVPWISGDTYTILCNRYIQYISARYGSPVTIVFDGYTTQATTKDSAHQRHSKSHGSVPVHFTSDMVCTVKREDFLVNKENKQKFINLLGSQLSKHGHVVQHAEEDADRLIVEATVKAATESNTVLVGDDTDLLIILCSKDFNTRFDVFFRPEPKSNVKKTPRCWDIRKLQKLLGKEICAHILFTHAILGCDTTSRVFGVGKPVALKKLKISSYFRQQAAVFQDSNACSGDIIAAGENALVSLYNGKPGEKLDTLRFHRFCHKVSSSTSYVQPRNLPPTSSAARYHSLRVYHQVQQWKGVDLNVEQWGWQITEGQMIPIQTDRKPAPDYLLEAIRCKCKTDCSTRRCSCRRYGLECSPACGDCKGLLCQNVTLSSGNDDEDI